MVTPEERQFLLDQVNRQASSDLQSLWVGASGLPSPDFALLIVEAFPEVAAPYAEMSAQLAATWFELSDPVSPYVAVTAPPIPAERLTQSAQWALGADGEQGLKRLEGSLQRSVFDGARETIVLNVENTGAFWVRHARPDACAFCRMLATRHTSRRSWYRTSRSAVDVVGGRSRGNRSVGSTGYHDDCRCQAVEVRRGQEYTPPDYVRQWDDELAKARANAGRGDAKSILSAWRQQGVK